MIIVNILLKKWVFSTDVEITNKGSLKLIITTNIIVLQKKTNPIPNERTRCQTKRHKKKYWLCANENRNEIFFFLSLDNNWLWHYLYYFFLIFSQLNFSQKRTHLLAADVLSNDVTKRKTKKKAFLFNILVLSFLFFLMSSQKCVWHWMRTTITRMHLTNPIIGQPKLCLSLYLQNKE